MYSNNYYNGNNRSMNENLKNGDVINKSFRQNRKKNGFYVSFRDNGKTYTVICYDSTYMPSSGKFTNVESRAGRILVSKR